MAAIELYTPQGAEMVSGMIYAPDEQDNNVKRCDTSCKNAIKMTVIITIINWNNYLSLFFPDVHKEHFERL